MGNNSKTFDHDAYYASKTLSELQGFLKSTEEFIEKYPKHQVGWHNERAQKLRLVIAERIGNGKQKSR